jgi:hypothetical protein
VKQNVNRRNYRYLHLENETMMKHYVVLLMLFFTLHVNGQILVEEGKPGAEKKEKVKSSTGGQTSIYAISNWSKTNRTLASNSGYFGDTLGTRADETLIQNWSFGLGLRNRINRFLVWDGGMYFCRNGEQYAFTGTDTTFAYQTTYSYIGMPLRLNFSMGKEIQWHVGAGLLPQMFVQYSQKQQWTTTLNSSDSQVIKTNSGYSPFVLSAIFNAGVQLNFSNGWGVLVSPEIRIQLNSTYLKQATYIHKARCYGVSFGLIKNL